MNVHQEIPKVFKYAEPPLTDGAVLSDYAFVNATTRVQDLLKESAPFMPFIDNSETVNPVKKMAIIHIQALD